MITTTTNMNKDEEMLNSNTEQNDEDLDSNNQEEENEDLDSTTQDDSDEGKSLEELNKQLYSRTKKAESELKRMRAQVEAFKKTGEKTNDSVKVDEFELTKLVHSLRDFKDDKELEIVKRQARGLGISLAEAAHHEDTTLLVDNYRKKQQNKEAVPETSSRQQPFEKSFNEWQPADINALMDDGSEESNKKLDEYYKWAKNN